MRNIKLFFLCMAVAAIATGCSSDDELTTAQLPVEVTNSDVKIHLASRSPITRSSIESDDNGMFEADGLGIFCLAKKRQSQNPEESELIWNPYYEIEGYKNAAAWLYNVRANAVYNEDTTGTNIEFVDYSYELGIDTTKYYFYPTGNWFTYGFYGYYPRQENVRFESPNRIVADMWIDGTQDIIWGKTADTIYCASYFRNKDHVEEIPNIAFQHRLMRLTFSTFPGKDAYGNIESALTMGVKSLKVKNVPTYGQLVIADKDNKEEEGKLIFDWENFTSDFELKDYNDAPLGADHWVKNDTLNSTPVGQGILLPVPEDGRHYYLEIVLKDKNGNEFQTEAPMELSGFSESFKPGYTYNVKMTIHGPKIIVLSATLEKWQIGEEDQIEL